MLEGTRETSYTYIGITYDQLWNASFQPMRLDMEEDSDG